MYAFSAVKAALRFAFASLCLERAWNLMKFGIAIAARMPMIATTIISSIRVKPLASFFMVFILRVIESGLFPEEATRGPERKYMKYFEIRWVGPNAEQRG